MNFLPGNKEYIPPTSSPFVAWNVSCLSARSSLQWLRKDTERHWVRKEMQNQEGSCMRGQAWRQEWDPMAKDLGPFDLELEKQGPRCSQFSKTALKTFNFISVITTREQMAYGAVDANAMKHRVLEEARHCSVGSDQALSS
uniref:Uncharacterized protein n=1 Tax=Pipistrellus kuhlii TaxID=59472 RepID=A0A7J7VMY0_PIPKU|nr:hypothetical protein mPipKuh1_008408 [Pipistrellus kuhlii]